MGRGIVAEKLKAAGLPIEVHADHFTDTERDEVWLSVVGKKRWIVISKDEAIRRRELELRALVKAKVRAVFLTSANLMGAQNADLILKALPQIRTKVASANGPMIVLAHASGKLVRIR